MRETKYCTFYNPVTWGREEYCNGRLQHSAAFSWLLTKDAKEMGYEVPKEGTLIGHISALPQELIQHVRWIRRVK